MGEDGAWSPEIPNVSASVTAGNSEAKDGPPTEMNASEGEQDSQSVASFGSRDPSDTSPPSIDALRKVAVELRPDLNVLYTTGYSCAVLPLQPAERAVR